MGVSPYLHAQHPPFHWGFQPSQQFPARHSVQRIFLYGVVWPRCWAGIPSGFCLIAISLCVFPPLDRHEGVLGSVFSANVSVIIKCISVGLTSFMLEGCLTMWLLSGTGWAQWLTANWVSKIRIRLLNIALGQKTGITGLKIASEGELWLFC